MSTPSGTLLGAVLLIRHGDRRGFYQDPRTYTSSQTSLTAFGANKVNSTGDTLRSRYLDASSPNWIQDAVTDGWDDEQFYIRADASDEGNVIFDSANVLTGGLWPEIMNTTIANGSSLSWKTLVPIESVEANEDVSLEGWLQCAPFTTSTNAFYKLDCFPTEAQESAAFLQSLPPYLDGRDVSLVNMWNIFDYINVQNTYNETFNKALPSGYLEQARDLANWHEYGVFTSPQLDGIANIAGRAILPTITTALTRIANSSDPLKLYIEQISYKPFLSLFNMTAVTAQNPQLAAIVDYASVLAFEVRAGSFGPTVNFVFKNGTDPNFVDYNMFSTDKLTLDAFNEKLSPAAINTMADWCTVCSNTQDRGCGALALASASASAAASASGHHGNLTNVQAGVIGAFVSLAVAIAVLAAMILLGIVTFGNRNKASNNRAAAAHDREANDASPTSSVTKA